MSQDNLRDVLEHALNEILANATEGSPPPLDQPTHVILGPGTMETSPAQDDHPPTVMIRPREAAVVIVEDGVSARRDAVKAICEGSQYQRKFSEKAVGEQIDSVVRGEAVSSSDRPVSDLVTDIFKWLEQSETEWQAFVPIVNVVLPETASGFSCGEFELIAPTQDNQDELRERIRAVVSKMKMEDDEQVKFEEMLWNAIEEITPAVWCFVQVHAGDKSMAFEQAAERARVVADLLQLPPPFSLSEGRRWVGVVGEVYRGRRLSMLFQEGSFETSLDWTGLCLPAQYDAELWERWQAEAAELWHAAGLPHEERSEMQTRCLEAVSWVSRSARAIYDEEKVVDCAIACELLLQPKSQSGGLTHAAAEGAAVLLAASVDERREIEVTVERLYGLRGDIVHGRFPRVDPAEVERFYWLAFRALLAVSDKLGEWGHISDVVSWIKEHRWEPPE